MSSTHLLINSLILLAILLFCIGTSKGTRPEAAGNRKPENSVTPLRDREYLEVPVLVSPPLTREGVCMGPPLKPGFDIKLLASIRNNSIIAHCVGEGFISPHVSIPGTIAVFLITYGGKDV